MPNNQRRLPRNELNATIDVWDALSDEHLGRLVNIHTEGLMLLSDHPLTENRLYQLRLTLPQNLSVTGELFLGADCLWVRASDDSGSHWSGCQIIDLADESLLLIKLLIERLAC